MIKAKRSQVTRFQALYTQLGATDRWLRSLKDKGGDAHRRFWALAYQCNPFIRKEVLCPQLIRQ